MKRPGYRLINWLRTHKLRTAGGMLGSLVLAYAVICGCVACSSSPANLTVELNTNRAVAYQQVAGNKPQAPAVILVHGAPADAGAWETFLTWAPELNTGPIIAIDRPGYGNSTDRDDLTLTGQAAAIEPFLTQVNGQKPILVGHSYGGPVILRAAVDYPDQIGALVLVAGATDATMKDAQGFRRGLNAVRVIVPETWERANRELLALTDENRAMQPMLKRITCPVVVIHGSRDPVCPCDSTIAYLQENLINAAEVRIVRIEGAGHNLHLSEPDLIVKEINRLVEQGDLPLASGPEAAE